MALKTCAIISSRPTRFKFKYNEGNTGCKRIKKRLRDQLSAFYRQGIRKFYVGGCLGVDLWAGEILLQLKEQPAYSDIELAIVAPFPNHDVRWDKRNRKRLQFLILHSVEHSAVGTNQNRDSFISRNRYMVDHADVLLAVYDNDRSVHSGTGQTVLYAERRSIPVVFIHPDTGIISVYGNHPQQTNKFLLVDL